MKIIRNYFYDDLSTDNGAFPCPRCRNKNITKESHPTTGQMATCGHCGARGPLKEWNDGFISYEKKEGKDSYGWLGKQFERSSDEKVTVTRNLRRTDNYSR